MTPDERQHLHDLRQVHKKRLYALELQQATTGNDTPAHIQVEIGDLKKIIFELDKKLGFSPVEDVEKPLEDHRSLGENSFEKVDIILRGDFERVNPEVMRALERLVAVTLDIHVQQVDILSVRKGSIIFTIVLPEDKAQQLLYLYKTQPAYFASAGIQDITSQQESKKDVAGTAKPTTLPQAYILQVRMEAFRVESMLRVLQDSGVFISQDVVISVLNTSALSIEDVQKALGTKTTATR